MYVARKMLSSVLELLGISNPDVAAKTARKIDRDPRDEQITANEFDFFVRHAAGKKLQGFLPEEAAAAPLIKLVAEWVTGAPADVLSVGVTAQLKAEVPLKTILEASYEGPQSSV